MVAGEENSIKTEELGSIFREEKKTGTILPIRKDFYPAVSKLLADLKEELRKSDPDSISYAGLRSKRETAQSNSRKIVEMRLKKIADMALRAAMGMNCSTDTLTPEEIEFYGTVLESAKTFWKNGDNNKKVDIPDVTKFGENPEPVPAPVTSPNVEKELSLDDIPYVPDDVPVVEKEEDRDIDEFFDEGFAEIDESPKTEQIVEPDDDIPEPEFITIRVTENLEPFAGPERDYHLKKEDVVKLPTVMAKVLVERNKAIYINI